MRPRKKVLAKPPKVTINDPVLWVYTKNEIIWMAIFIFLGTFISFVPIIPTDEPLLILRNLLIFTLIISTSIAAKKLVAKRHAIKIEHRDWILIQWWFLRRTYFKKKLHLGLIAPVFIAIFTIGYLKPFAFFQFESENDEERRILKKHGFRSKTSKELINEEDYGYTAAAGMYALLILATIGSLLSMYLPSFGSELTKYSLFYGLWNLLPAGQLDGAKIFFGTTLQWTFLVIVYTISLIFVLI